MVGEFRLHRNLVAEGGWTGAWMATYYDRSRFSCSYSRLENTFFDYGMLGVLPLTGGRIELPLGVGGGYIWFDSASGDNHYYNGFLFQYSGKAVVALDRNGHWRINFSGAGEGARHPTPKCDKQPTSVGSDDATPWRRTYFVWALRAP